MTLSLKITSYQRLTPSQPSTYQAESDSFTIGRNSDNDWAIPDPQRFLSGKHCRIHKEGADYYITDTSTNGVFMNGSEERLTRNDSVALEPGDKFRIGDYEFEILIDDDALAGNPFTASDETMIEADPFNDPLTAYDQLSEPDPFADEDPFSEAEPEVPPQEQDDDFLKDINTPLSHLDESPLGTPVSIDDLMNFDDDDERELEEQETAEKLEQRNTPLREAFKPSTVGSTPAAPAAPTSADDKSFNISDLGYFPVDWYEATGMLKIPEGNDPFGSPASSDIPDDWDEATGMFIAPEAPPPPKAPKPPKTTTPGPPEPIRQAAPPARPAAPPARPPTPPARPPTPAYSEPAAQAPSGDAMAAFARGAGLELSQVAGIDQSVLFEQVGRMLVMFTEGLIQTLGGRTHIKSEFRLDQTMIRPAENNPFKFSTSKTRTVLQLLSKSDPAYMTGANAIKEGFDDVNAHQMAVIAGMEAALQDILGRFNPKTLETRMVSDSILDNILPGGKKAKYWDIFKILFDEIAGEAEDDFQQLFGREFSRAYEEQLSRLKNTGKE
jgi:type VI secretion system protein